MGSPRLQPDQHRRLARTMPVGATTVPLGVSSPLGLPPAPETARAAGAWSPVRPDNQGRASTGEGAGPACGTASEPQADPVIGLGIQYRARSLPPVLDK